MKIGQLNRLTILRFTSVGAYLGDDEDNDVLLPNKYLSPEMEVDDELDVFLYRDSEDRIVATTENPYIQLNSFAYLKITEVNFYGAFADWGLEKELMIPFKEQHNKLIENQNYLCTLLLDEATDRLYGSTKINKYLIECKEQNIIGQKATILIGERSELGYQTIVNNKYRGLIYHSDIQQNIQSGDLLEGYVYQVRDDGKVDVRLGKFGHFRIDDNAQKLETILKRHGKLSIHDKSAPEIIQETVGMSKKAFKQAVGQLYKNRLIEIQKNGIVWLDN